MRAGREDSVSEEAVALLAACDVVDHLLHISDIAGEDCPALGSDWDGAVRPPKELGSPRGLVKIVEELLHRRVSAERIRKILCGNTERTLARLRP